MEFDFWIKTNDLDTARQLVERATGLKAIKLHNIDLGGTYYSFPAPHGEIVELISNRDLFDNQPYIDGYKNISLILFVRDASEESKISQDLGRDTDHFILIKKT